MKLLLTGAFSYTAEQIKELGTIVGEVVYMKDEREEITFDVSDIDIVVCNNLFLYHPIEQFKQVKLIQLTSAGFDRVPMDYIKSKKIPVENAKGVYSIPMAEWVILMILQFYKKSKNFHWNQWNHQWVKQRDLLELSGKTAIIVGFGSVGREVAKRLRPFDLTIIGIDLTLMESDLADEFYTFDQVDQVLDRADILILALPLTPETYRFINRERLSKLKRTCILINVSRGAIIDEKALIVALYKKQLYGVALDVFEEEPLNRESPLWEFENVIITPHNSYVSEQVGNRLYTLMKNNISNFVQHYHTLKTQEIKKYRYCIVTTMSSSIDYWIKPFLPLYHKYGFEITVLCNMTPEYRKELKKKYPYIKAISIPMPRGVDFAKSIKAIQLIYKVLKKGEYHMVQYSTPNASLYTAIAAYFARIPIRLYCQWGMVFVTMKGFKRFAFQMMERLVCLLSTQVQPDSHGNLIYCRKRRFYSKKKSTVIWNGSAKGVDFDKFNIHMKEIYRREIRKKYEIDKDSIVLGFVGRLGKEKGCQELFEGFKILEKKYPNLKLLFVGPLEKEETIDPALLKWFYANKRIIKTDRVPDVEKYMAAMDIFILPSYREGFGMSVAEAGAMGVPVIVTDIPGPINAMLPGVTGITIPVKDMDALVDAVEELVNDEEKRIRFAKAGYEFVKSHFDSKIFAKKLLLNRMKLVKGCKKI
ncbi:MAG TPA: glycosyltransferase [Clostridiales bacterium]|nr:glycosyltransferase [Clostridiales bacterium]